MKDAPARILIVEDDLGVARLQQKRLERAGHAVQIFAQPQEAATAIRAGEADLIILDYRLSGERSGLDFYEELKRDGHDLPAILVTGFADETLIIAALRAGMKDFVSKSIEYLDYLPEAVGRVLRQRQIERRLAETEARFERVFRASPLGIAVTTVEEGRYIDANDAFLEILGCTRSDAIGATSAELGVRPLDFHQAAYRLHTQHSGESPAMEIALTNCQGRSILLELSVEVIDLDGVPCLLKMAQDISERRRAEEQLRLQHRAISAVTEGILISDAVAADHPLVFVNEAFQKLTGYSPAEAIGRNCRFLQGPDTDPAGVAEIRAALRAGRSTTVEILNYRRDGSTFWNLLSITPVRDAQGMTTHFVGVQRDVTEQKFVAEQLRQSQKMEAIGRLAGGIAHDFNNILTIILGNTELALEDLDEQRDCRELLGEIAEAGQRAAGLTRQLLAFSRRQVIEPRVLDLNEIVREAERLLQRLIGADVLLSTSLEPRLRKIKADPVQLEQILLNLTVNARDAMPQGGRLILETRNVDLDRSHGLLEGDIRPGPYVMLAVSDTGLGMDAETRSRIFEPFFTTKQRGRGTGMGLSTVYGIVQQSQGYVWVYSEVGHGTTFKIYLPEDASAQEAAPASSVDRQALAGTETVLLVEDEAMVRSIARRMLEGQGYQVLEAASGSDALDLAQQHAGPIDLVVTDVIMPGMNGRQLSDALTALRPEMRTLYVSGYTDNTISHHGVLEPGVTFLQKPFSNESLSAKVRSVLDGTA